MSHLTTNPDVALLALVVGVFGIYTELLRPGSIFPGICGCLLAVIGLAGFAHADWRGATIVLAAFPLLVMEAFCPARYLLSALAAAAVCWGAMMAEPHLHLLTTMMLLVPFTLITSFLLKIAVRARRNKTTGFRLRDIL